MVILVVVVFNAGLGFYQECRAARAQVRRAGADAGNRSFCCWCPATLFCWKRAILNWGLGGCVMAKMREVHPDMPITAHALSDRDMEDIAAPWTFNQ